MVLGKTNLALIHKRTQKYKLPLEMTGTAFTLSYLANEESVEGQFSKEGDICELLEATDTQLGGGCTRQGRGVPEGHLQHLLRLYFLNVQKTLHRDEFTYTAIC